MKKFTIVIIRLKTKLIKTSRAYNNIKKNTNVDFKNIIL